MSPIFNHHALSGLPTSALEHLRATLVLMLASPTISDAERAQFHAALESVHAVLRNRAAQPRTAPAAPSP